MNKRHIKHTKPVESRQIRDALLNILQAHLPLHFAGRGWDETTLWDILIYASVHQTTIETACAELAKVPSGNTVRAHLTAALDGSPDYLFELQEQLNQALHAQLPNCFRHSLKERSYDIAVDLVELPYHGQPLQDPREVRRGLAKSGTTHFHTYATLAIVHDQQRYELALTFVWADESPVQVVQRLLERVQAFGLRIHHAYLDKGFRGSAILQLLRERHIPYVIPVPLCGRTLRGLCRGRRSYRTRYTFNPKTAKAYTAEVVIVCKYTRGRRGKHQVEWPYMRSLD